MCHRVPKGKYGKGGFAPDPAVIITPVSLPGGEHHCTEATPVLRQHLDPMALSPKAWFFPQLLEEQQRCWMPKRLICSYYWRPQEGEEDNEATAGAVACSKSSLSCIKSVCSSSFLGSSKQSLSFQNLNIRKSQLKAKWKWNWSSVCLYVVPYPNWQGRNISSRNDTKFLPKTILEKKKIKYFNTNRNPIKQNTFLLGTYL